VQPLLPSGALPSRFDDDRGYAFTHLLALRWMAAGDHDNQSSVDEQALAILKRYAEELQTRLRGVAGTDLVQLYGEPDEEIRVVIDPEQAAALNLSPNDIATAIGAADAKVAAGTLRNPHNELLIEVAGELDSVERIRRIPLPVNSDDSTGQFIRVGDIAQVTRAVATPPDEIALVYGEPALVVAARMLPDMRIDTWSERVDETLQTFEQILPGNVALKTIFDQRHYTDTRLGELVTNILIGFLLILAVLLVTLGLKAAFIVALALPLTVSFTLICMQYYGLPIHQMSVTGLVVALGIMVDNAIVITDAIQRKRQGGYDALTAVVESVRHLWLPLLGSTLTTILAFSPIALMPGPGGEFVGGIGLSVIFALIGSYIISHTLIAGLAGRFLTPQQAKQPVWYRNGIRLTGLTQGFRATLEWALQHPLLATGLVVLVPLAGFLGSSQLTEQFFPPSDRDMFHMELRLPTQTSIQGTRAQVAAISKILKEYDGIESIHWFIGNNAPPFYYNMVQNQDGLPYFAQAMVTAADFRVANRLIPELQQRLDDRFPEAQILVRKLEQGPPFNAPVEVRLYGPNLDTLRRLGDRVRQMMLATKDVVHTRATLASGKPKVWVKTRDEVTQLAGLPLTQVAQQLQNALDGAVNGSVLEGTEELPVRVRVDGLRRQQLSDLSALPIASPLTSAEQRYAGAPISALADLDIRPTRGAIPRRDGQRVNVIEGYIRAGVLPQTVVDRFSANLDVADFVLPAGYRLQYGGEAAERDDAVGNLLANLGVIATLLVLVVVLSFNSFRLSGIIFAVAAQAAGLGMLVVYLFGYPFGFTVIVGLLGLIGLAINAAIVILAELKTDARAVIGDREAIAEGVMSCTRHITSTTITTVGGFLPLILEGGGFWPPFAIAIAGGTVLTTLLSFYFVPAVFYLMARRRPFEVRQSPDDGDFGRSERISANPSAKDKKQMHYLKTKGL
jgi:multidrug efflux pump subunit AcrB